MKVLPDSAVRMLASVKCFRCNGRGICGMLVNGHIEPRLCECMLRAVFRKCWEIEYQYSIRSRSQPEARSCGMGIHYGFFDREYAADLDIIARRGLPKKYYRIYKRHMRNREAWQPVAQQAGLPCKPFFTLVYRIQAALGAQYLKYGLYPHSRYRSGRGLPTEQMAKATPARLPQT